MALRCYRKSLLWTIPDLSAWALCKRVAGSVLNHNLTGYSAQLAYYFFLSLFPSLLFLTTLLAFLPIHHRTEMILNILGHALPKQALLLVKGNLEGIVHQHKSGLLSFSVLFALYSASNAIMAISAGLNHAYGVAEERPYWRVLLMAILLVLGLVLVLTIAFAIFFFGPHLATLIAKQFGLRLWPATLTIIRWPILLFALVLATAIIYYFTPNVHQKWHWLTPGSAFAITGWIGTSLLLAFYVNHFGSYNRTYGSIGVVIILLTWMYLGGLMLLIGGEINSALKRLREDTCKKSESSTEKRGCKPSH